MNKIELIKAEIERLKKELVWGACAAQIEMETNCKAEAYDEVLSFIATLDEPSEDLEVVNDLTEGTIKAVRLPDGRYVTEKLARESGDLEEEIREYMSDEDNNPFDWDGRDKRDFARHFAQWQKEQDDKEQADLFTIVALDAAQRARDEMMKEAVNGEVVKTLDGSLRVSSYIFKRDGFEFGDKVKLIIVKEK